MNSTGEGDNQQQVTVDEISPLLRSSKGSLGEVSDLGKRLREEFLRKTNATG